MFKKFSVKNSNKGMTFLELVVVIGIFSAISATVLFNYRSFSDNIRLQNLSQEIALQGKRAQTLASQGRRPTFSPNSAQFQYLSELVPSDWISSYGIAFSLEGEQEGGKSFIFYFNSPIHYGPDSSSLEGKNLYFHEFADSIYGGCDSNPEGECLEEIFITDGSYISLICSEMEPNEMSGDDCGGQSVSQLHVSFTRPFLEAYIMTGDSSGLDSVSHAFVRITSQSGEHRYITFWTTGQITVN